MEDVWSVEDGLLIRVRGKDDVAAGRSAADGHDGFTVDAAPQVDDVAGFQGVGGVLHRCPGGLDGSQVRIAAVRGHVVLDAAYARSVGYVPLAVQHGGRAISLVLRSGGAVR